MNRSFTLAAFAICLSVLAAFGAEAATLTWTRVGTLAGAADIAGCGSGRAYARKDDGRLYVNRNLSGGAAWERIGILTNPGSLTCANNVLYHFDSSRILFRNDGTLLGLPITRVGSFPGTRDISGGTIVALIIPVPLFLRLDFDGSVHLTPDPAGPWTPIGTAGGAARLAVGGGFLDWRAYAQNFDNTVWENAGHGCDSFWRQLGIRATLDDISSFQVDQLIGLDRNDSIHVGTITHERRDIRITNSDLAAFVNPLLVGTRFRAHGNSASFTPSPAMAALGMRGNDFLLAGETVSLGIFGSTTYTPNDINLTRFTIGTDGTNITLDGVFEEEGLELLTSNGIAPNLNISGFNGRLLLNGQLDLCGQPGFGAAGAVFNGTFSGVNNLFSFIVDLMNGEIRARVQNRLTNAGNEFLMGRGAQLSLQQAMMEFARLRTDGRPWSHIVGPTFRISGGTVFFSVER